MRLFAVIWRDSIREESNKLDVRIALVRNGEPVILCNAQIFREKTRYSKDYFVKTPTLLGGTGQIKATTRGGEEYILRIKFDRRDDSEKEFPCIHRILYAEPSLSF
ncbi:MAG: hypothetical protein ACD_25C00233G0002 [uncultured bacterium]|uniref:Uncharacterized protein n=1 Tax=candidate division WWE3 bacterium TaxID=2053526 RepID=A0A656PNU6_UNCKA|nr:MAG: hypothetical protein ACD_25C00233G0002 [uncultured bacterium]OGC67200.1 MAG: hypothetical protein A2364_03190 [candidate division WWE3 bacterium RIFOXYB1_FULL_43_12]HAI95065.1 hypothetical protein [candidate division WWE3 bacterium]HBL00287.1 hypothetical protein [candidate division WWE3 bacterium]HBT66439.1 hypothetical protein [candidate division WWE3 bacterium]